MLDILIRPYPQKTAGIPVKYGYTKESGEFWFHYLPGSDQQDSSVIFIPQRAYPQGWEFGKHLPGEGSFRWDEESRKLFLAPASSSDLQKIEILRSGQ